MSSHLKHVWFWSVLGLRWSSTPEDNRDIAAGRESLDRLAFWWVYCICLMTPLRLIRVLLGERWVMEEQHWSAIGSDFKTAMGAQNEPSPRLSERASQALVGDLYSWRYHLVINSSDNAFLNEIFFGKYGFLWATTGIFKKGNEQPSVFL